MVYAKRIVKWNRLAKKLAKRFFPGALTLVLGLRAKGQGLTTLSAGTGELGVRQPKNDIALDLAKYLRKPITTTSANLAGLPESYSLFDLQKQFGKKRNRPDIIINAGKLKHQYPSTLIKINQDQSIQVLRPGSVSEKNIKQALRGKG